MAGKYPPVRLDCRDGPQRSGCGHSWESPAAPGSTIRCPNCGKGARMPADRPRTAAQARGVGAAGDDDGLATAWEAEGPPARWLDCLGPEAGQNCGTCGSPMRWTGAHTAIACPGHDTATWSISPGVRDRSAANAAALDKRANRTAATIADPAAERARRAGTDRAAIELAQRKGIMLRQLAELADDKRLHPDSLPIVEWFEREARAATTDERLDALADLLPESGIRRRHWWQGAPEALDPWDDQADDEYPEPLGDDDQDDDDPDSGPLAQLAQLAAEMGARECAYCRDAGRPRIASAWLISEPDGALMPACPQHYRWARAKFGPTMLARELRPSHGEQLAAMGRQLAGILSEPRALPAGLPPASCRGCGASRDPARPERCPCGRANWHERPGTPVPGYVPPDPNWRAKATPAEREYWDRIMGARR